VREESEPTDDLLVDVQVLRPLQRVQGFVVVPVFDFDFGDFVDGAGDCPFVGVEFDSLFVADDGVVGLFWVGRGVLSLLKMRPLK
jgi:hypothetical protein